MDQALRLMIWRRAGSRCEYCQMHQQHDAVAFEIDHIIAESHGGPTQADNLALSCYYCNLYKAANLAGVDPVTKRITQLFHPRRHQWNRHFRWHGPELEGRTAIGRATVVVLRINLLHRVLQRATLIEEGAFPPSGRTS